MDNNRPTAIYCDITGMWLTIEDEEKYGDEPCEYECDLGDSMLGYSITNYEGKAVDITVGSHYGRITLDTLEAA